MLHAVAESTEILIGKDASIRAGKDIERRIASRAGRYRIVSDSRGFLALGNVDRAIESGPRVLLAGEIVTRTTILEVINVIATANWRGDLRIFSTDEQRGLHIDSGAVKHGHSDHPDDRLGEVLFRMGVLTRPQMDALLREVTPERRFGAVLIQRGVATREQLFNYLQKQVEEIFFNALLMRSGTFSFTSPDDTGMPPPATVHLPVQMLLMEGVQRIDEMALFRERIPHGRMVPEIKSGAMPPKKIDATGEKIWNLIDAQRTILDLARETSLGEFETTKSVYNLLTTGTVILHATAKEGVDTDDLGRMLRDFGGILKDIFQALARHGAADATHLTLQTWIKNGPHSAMLGDALQSNGALDATKLQKNIELANTERPLEKLHQALHQLSGFALFTATMTLPRDEEMTLSRDINKRLKLVRI